MEKKYIPERKCISCGTKNNKSDLIRIAKEADDFIPDIENRFSGRGAYICKNSDCILNLEKRNALSRAFEQKVAPNQYQKLKEELSEHGF